MSRGLIITVIGAIIAAPGIAGWLPGIWSLVAGWLGVVLTVSGGLLQEYDGKPFELKFVPNDWVSIVPGNRITVSAATHKKGRAATGEIYTRLPSGQYATCMCDVLSDLEGNIHVEIIASPFEGRLVIR